MVRRAARWITGFLALGLLAYGYRKLIPVYRIESPSELVMLGDLDGDRAWRREDRRRLDEFLADPFAFDSEVAFRLDLNQNGLLDEEDIRILDLLVAHPDPYAAEVAARGHGIAFPRPRELYRYVSAREYLPRPLWTLPRPGPDSGIPWMKDLEPVPDGSSYAGRLDNEVYQESVRLEAVHRKRHPGLEPPERDYLKTKLARCEEMLHTGSRFELLLELIALVEDGETLGSGSSRPELVKLLRLRDSLRELMQSDLFEKHRVGKVDSRALLHAIEGSLRKDLAVVCDLERLGPPRNLTNLENYLQRAEWQYYKTTNREDDFRRLLVYAQHDSRYLRAVSRTSPKHLDPRVENHNLPMVLLFREALHIQGGDKKKAVGLLDEAIRIPFAWIKTIPREKLPGSLAMESFLLPGNKEDGADKSRHWNVFGGICLYKSPQEALDLALRREMNDLREAAFSHQAFEEFLRDMIANLNGMYHVMAMDPSLLTKTTAPR